MGDAEKFIVQNIVIAVVGIIINLAWDYFSIQIQFVTREFHLGNAQLSIIAFLSLWLFINIDRWRYYK